MMKKFFLPILFILAFTVLNSFFIIKEGHYYEPIVYRVNLLKSVYELKILSKNIFSSFEVFDKETFKKFLVSPYPRGSIALQAPYFSKNGLNLSGFWYGTLNLSLYPIKFINVEDFIEKK